MVYIIVIFILFFIDLVIKNYVRFHIKKNDEISLLNGKISIEKLYNDGAALGILRNHKKILAFVTGSFTIVLAGMLFLKAHKGEKLYATGLSVVLAGALNNGYERFIRTKVTDYIRFPKCISELKKIVFNISDFFIFIGSILSVIADYKKK